MVVTSKQDQPAGDALIVNRQVLPSEQVTQDTDRKIKEDVEYYQEKGPIVLPLQDSGGGSESKISEHENTDEDKLPEELDESVSLIEELEENIKNLEINQEEKNAQIEKLERERETLSIEKELLTRKEAAYSEQIKQLREERDSAIKEKIKFKNVLKELSAPFTLHSHIGTQMKTCRRESAYEISPSSSDGIIGAALIISIHKVKFKNNTEKVGGAEEDDALLMATFEEVGFRMLRVIIDCSKDEIDDRLDKLDSKLQKNDKILICYINSHGGSDEQGDFFYDCNGKEVHIQRIYSKIVDCNKLKKKPKVVVCDACRGDKEDVVSTPEQRARHSDLMVVQQSTAPKDCADLMALHSAAPKHKAYGIEPQQEGAKVNDVDNFYEEEEAVDEEEEANSVFDEEENNDFVKHFCEALKKWDCKTDLQTSICENVIEPMQGGSETALEVNDKIVRQCPFIMYHSLKGPITRPLKGPMAITRNNSAPCP